MPQADMYYEVDVKEDYKHLTVKQRDYFLRNQLCDDCHHANLIEGKKLKSGVQPFYRECKKKVVPFKNSLYIPKKAINITLTCYNFEEARYEGWDTNQEG